MSVDCEALFNPEVFADPRLPPQLFTQGRAWFLKEMVRLEPCHNASWPDHAPWLADHMNEELRERVAAYLEKLVRRESMRDRT